MAEPTNNHSESSTDSIFQVSEAEEIARQLVEGTNSTEATTNDGNTHDETFSRPHRIDPESIDVHSLLDGKAEGSPPCLPAGLRLLCIGPIEPDWIGVALQLDAVGCHEPRLQWVSNASSAMKILRTDAFDCIIVADPASPGALQPLSDEQGTSSLPPPQEASLIDSSSVTYDAVALIQAIRASGCDDPLVYLAEESSDKSFVAACQMNCGWLSAKSLWNSKALVAVVQRTIHTANIVKQNHQLAVANHRRLVRERDEAGQLLQQQRDIISELESLASRRPGELQESDPADVIEVPDEIKRFYQELLRTYVIMGSGSLGGEIGQLAQILTQLKLSPRDTLSLHLERVEELVRGLGNRSTRHVMARADLLAIELIIHLGECYQQIALAGPGN